jgi:hypothetical protein
MKKIFLAIGAVFLLMSFSSMAFALAVTPTADPAVLVNNILGSGITTSNITYVGGPVGTPSSATFTGGLASGIGMDAGIILTSGQAADAPGPNLSDSVSKSFGPGDTDLAALVLTTTFDATVLEFDFVSAGGDLFFNYVFASDEYNEWTNSQYNDVFAFFLDTTNIALIPGTSTPVSVNNVNGGNPLGTNASNSAFFNNNDIDDGGPFFDIQYDGFTDVFTATALGLSPGMHHIKLAIADTSDGAWDSAVFIQSGTFSDKPPDNNPVPEPASMLLLGCGLVSLAAFRKKFRK